MDRRTKLILAGCLGCFLLAVTLFMFVVSLTYQAPAGEEQPKVTDWMQGWGSIAGVFAGVVAAGAAGWLLLHEKEQVVLARQEAAEQREELALSAARAVVADVPRLSVDQEGRLTRITFKIHNFGPMPVRYIRARVTPPAEPMEFHFHNPVAPGGSTTLDRYPDEMPVVTTDPNAIEFGSIRANITLYFFDASGREWVRDDNGEPERIISFVRTTPEWSDVP